MAKEKKQEIKIYSSKVHIISEEKATISWEGNLGFGDINITYLGKGKYELDSEYLGVETMIKIFQKSELIN